MTTIVLIRKNKEVVVASDGQVSMGSMIVKGNAKKLRTLDEGKVVVGFAGGAADGLTLVDRLEEKLEQYPGQLLRSSVELAKDWRMDRGLRRLDASMLVCDETVSLEMNGGGDVLEPIDGLMAIGSGGTFALAAARALGTPSLWYSASALV